MIRLMLALAATPALADSVTCTMEDGTPVSFVIDRSQFVTAVSPEEPIRRKVTNVQMGAARFPAEPFLIGDMRGFHADGLGGAQIMFVVQPDGSAKRSNSRTGATLTGQCQIAE